MEPHIHPSRGEESRPDGPGGRERPEEVGTPMEMPAPMLLGHAARLLGRALRLRCPACGGGRMFRGAFAMNRRCARCGLWFEREPGYFLGAIYFNYGLTAGIVSAVYLGAMLVSGRPRDELLLPLVAFCVAFPLFFYRYARALWLAFDHYVNPLDVAERPHHERDVP